MNDEKTTIMEMAKVIEITEQIARDAHCGLPSPTMYAKDLYWHGYRKQSEWISVDERLPEKEQIVLCCLGLVMNVYTYKGNRIWEDSYGYWQKDEPITHWMPLPELPKGE